MQESHNKQKKIALINDFTGFGRCSISVALPIISALKVQCCPLPTSVFSNHTGFSSYFMEDFTKSMERYADEWKKLGLCFSGISTGFLGSAEQIRIVDRFISDFRDDHTIVIMDPVMGDQGTPYATYTNEMCRKMRDLIHHADILTPNLTEACILTDTPYRPDMKAAKALVLAERLSAQGPSKVVISGLSQKSYICNLCYEKGKSPFLVKTKRIGTERCGTGDIFSAIISADAVNEVPFKDSVQKASIFIKKCVQRSIDLDIPLTDGVCFEEFLHTLH